MVPAAREVDDALHVPLLDQREQLARQREVAEMVGAHLNDCDLVLVFQREDGQRGTGLVVEIALRFHHVKLCAERGCTRRCPRTRRSSNQRGRAF